MSVSHIPGDLRYTKEHEWALSESGDVVFGITDFAQQELGDVVFVELPKIGRSFASGEAACVVESVKAASDVYCPLEGTVTAVNEKIVEDPSLINRDPYNEGWLFRLLPQNPAEFEELMSAQEYQALLEDR